MGAVVVTWAGLFVMTCVTVAAAITVGAAGVILGTLAWVIMANLAWDTSQLEAKRRRRS